MTLSLWVQQAESQDREIAADLSMEQLMKGLERTLLLVRVLRASGSQDAV